MSENNEVSSSQSDREAIEKLEVAVTSLAHAMNNLTERLPKSVAIESIADSLHKMAPPSQLS